MQPQDPIAIIGIGCRFPGGASSPAEFWDLVAQGRSAYSDVPTGRWNSHSFQHPNGERKGFTNVNGGHFLKEDLRLFDAPFFSITPNEAKVMDPQQRMLLEVTYEALENAGIPLKDLVGSKTSCYMGDFSSRDYDRNMDRDPEQSAMQRLSGNSMAILSNRISHFFDLHGPSMTIDTACSSSLVAFHLACQSIKAGESDMAIVGGVNLMLSPDMTKSLDALHLLSPDGKSYAFDHRANGYGRGEGLGVTILKPMKTAIRDNNHAWAVVRGSGCNQDGSTKSLHLPSAKAQETLIRDTYARAGLDMGDTAFCEAHGTGTVVGDSLEAEALSATFGKARRLESPLMIASGKTNVGHLEGGAGIAAVIKTALSLKMGWIPPSINLDKLSPRIPFNINNLEVVKQLRKWPEGVRRASINSFGFGGTNCHVILDSADEQQQNTATTNGYDCSNGFLNGHVTNGVDYSHFYFNGNATNGVHRLNSPSQHGLTIGEGSNGVPTCAKAQSQLEKSNRKVVPKLICWSAHDEGGLERLCTAFFEYIASKIVEHAGSKGNKSDSDLLSNLAYTLNSRRTSFQWKSHCVVSTTEDLRQRLSLGVSKAVRATKPLDLAFVFTGQGAQWYAMGRELWVYQVYRKSLTRADTYLSSLGCTWSVIEELERDEKTTNIDKAAYSQPLCTILQVALVELLRSWGVRPRIVVGHSSGEIAGAYCLGAISSEAAWKLAYHRGRVSTPRARGQGAMLSVGLGETDTLSHLAGLLQKGAVIACVNSPSSVTVSGDACAVDEVATNLALKGIFTRKLRVDAAYHSHHMRAVADDYLNAIQDMDVLATGTSDIEMFSSVTGKLVDQKDLGPKYWVDNLVSPVRFSDAVHNLSKHPPRKRRRRQQGQMNSYTWLEIGPHGAMSTPVRQTLTHTPIEYFSVISRGKNAISTVLHAAGDLWTRGCPVDVSVVNNPDLASNKRPVLMHDLPSYPWNHGTQYWLEPRISREYRFRKHPRQDLLGARLEGPSEPTWRQFLRPTENPWIEDYKLHSKMIYPTSGMITMAIEAANQLANNDGLMVSTFELEKVKVHKQLLIPAGDDGVETQLRFRTADIDASENRLSTFEFIIDSLDVTDQTWQRNCSGKITTALTLDHLGSISEASTLDTTGRGYKIRCDTDFASCKRTKTPDQIYWELAVAGNEYGKTFRNLTRVRASQGRACCIAQVPDIAGVMPDNFQYPHVIHPATLESLMQMVLTAAMHSEDGLNDALSCNFIEKIIVLGAMPSKPGDEIEGFASGVWAKDNTVHGNVLAYHSGTQQASISISAMKFGKIPSIATSQNLKLEIDRAGRYTQLEWKIAPDSFQRGDTVPLHTFLDSILHEKPDLKILQIGGPVEGTSRLLLEIASTHGYEQPRLSSFTYSAVSTQSLEDARKVLAAWDHCTQYQILDILEDPVGQGFESSSFDVIIFHSLRDTVSQSAKSLARLRGLLRSQGRLLILDEEGVEAHATQPALAHRSVSDVWHEGLIDEGFAWVELHLDALCADGINASPSLIATTRRPQNSDWKVTNLLIIQPEILHDYAQAILNKAVERLSTLGLPIIISDIHHVCDECLDGVLVVMLGEVFAPLLLEMGTREFTSIQKLALKTPLLLWITAGDIMSGGNPELSLVNGFARCLFVELEWKGFATLDIGRIFNDSSLDGILKVCSWLCSESCTDDREFALRDGHIYIPKIAPMKPLDDWIKNHGASSRPQQTRLGDVKCPLQLTWDHQGRPGYQFNADAPQELSDYEVEIGIKAMALDQNSLASSDRSLGVEWAGTITRCGSKIQRFNVGDPVMTIKRSSHQNLVRAEEGMVQDIHTKFSFEEAVQFPLAYCTAYLALVTTARLCPEDKILVHNVEGMVRQAIIGLARSFGNDVYVTADSSEEKARISELHKIPETHVLCDDSQNLMGTIMDLSHDHGIDIVISSSLDKKSREAWRCIAYSGRYVQVNRHGTAQLGEFDMEPFQRTAAFLSVNFIDLFEHKPQKAAMIFREVHKFLGVRDSSAVIPSKSFTLSEAANAVEMMSQQHSLKAILVAHDDDIIQVASAPRRFHLDKEASYMLVGGLGGVGRSIAQFFVRHGARSLIFLSRSGVNSEEAQDLIDSLMSRGVRVTVHKCDIGDADQIQQVVADCTLRLPPIRGIIQAAMVLRDSSFEKMTADDWMGALRPKVRGSWNLHLYLPEDMDFFIMLSSVVGVCGNKGQANYAAANTYQDVLALHRRSKGLRATAIDLGWMLNAGAVAEHWQQTWRLRNSGLEGLHESELHLVIEAAITDNVKEQGAMALPAQIIMGLSTGGMVERNGAMDRIWMSNAKFAFLRTIGSRQALSARLESSQPHLRQLLNQATSQLQVRDIITEGLVNRLLQSTGLDKREVDVSQPILALGTDSLVAIELRGWAKRELKADISGLDVLSNIAITEVARKIAEASALINWNALLTGST